MIVEFISALLIGAFGSVHCVFMCGPIALAIPFGGNGRISRTFSILIYNTGRILTYSLFGLFFGFIGSGLFMIGLQQTLSILTGIVILLSLTVPFKKIKSSMWAPFGTFYSQLRSRFASLLQMKGHHIVFILGMLNGLLPCGLVFVALAGAMALGDHWQGMMFMAGFGLGTLPVMMIMSFFRNALGHMFQGRLRKAIPVLISVVGLLMIMRGLNLGIPYLSPKWDGANAKMECCTEKGKCETKR